MPRGDGTGPMGMGAMTGRAAGFCAGYAMPGNPNVMPERSFGMGFGRGRGIGARGAGRGRRNMFFARNQAGWPPFGGNAASYAYAAPFQKPDPEMEKQALKNQAETLQSELDFIKKRLDELDNSASAQ
ncbi:MAG: hypothetical protein EHM45_03390 [Desulfobacteraceae bacterium]|nr:MAG: hypothetical protein EHM45_03390 [Desulfobacteraceae bacterium]